MAGPPGKGMLADTDSFILDTAVKHLADKTQMNYCSSYGLCNLFIAQMHYSEPAPWQFSQLTGMVVSRVQKTTFLLLCLLQPEDYLWLLPSSSASLCWVTDPCFKMYSLNLMTWKDKCSAGQISVTAQQMKQWHQTNFPIQIIQAWSAVKVLVLSAYTTLYLIRADFQSILPCR